MSSSPVVAQGALRRWRKGPTSPEWGEGGLAVTPLLGSEETLPSNLKLAADAWPEAWEQEEERDDDFSGEDSEPPPNGEGNDDSEFSTEEDAESLSEEDVDAIEALLDIPAFTGTQVEVFSWADGGSVGTRLLAPSVFGTAVRRDVVHDVVRWQLAKRRRGNAKTKRIGEIRGSGRKVRPQKGSGGARAGHSRPPHWRGGAKAHGPRQRDFSFKLNRKYIKLGLRVALSARLREGQLKVVDNLTLDSFSTSKMLKTLEARGIPKSTTFIVGGVPQPELVRSSRNIVGTRVLAARGANVYDIIKRPSLVLTEDAVTHLEELLEAK